MNDDLIRHLHLSQVVPMMALLSICLLPALLAQALCRANKPIRGGRQTAIMAIFGLVPFQVSDALLLRRDESFENSYLLLLSVDGNDGLFESFTQVLVRLLQVFQFFLFAQQRFLQDTIICSQLFEVFILRHAATLTE